MQLRNTESDCTVDDLSGIESRFDLVFPAEYRDFLLRNNGGDPEPSWYSMNGEYEDEISYFLAVNASNPHSDIATQIENYRDWIVPAYLPIAVCCGGDVLCLSLKDEELGAIYHWNHALANDAGNPWEENMTRLAGSLAEFLGGVSTLEDLESQRPIPTRTVVPVPYDKPWWKFW